jgi:hypothetical protein
MRSYRSSLRWPINNFLPFRSRRCVTLQLNTLANSCKIVIKSTYIHFRALRPYPSHSISKASFVKYLEECSLDAKNHYLHKYFQSHPKMKHLHCQYELIPKQMRWETGMHCFERCGSCDPCRKRFTHITKNY